MGPRGCSIYEPVASSIAGTRVKENQRQSARPPLPYASPSGLSAQALPIKMAFVFLVTFYSIKLHLVLMSQFTLLFAKTVLWLPVVPRTRGRAPPMASEAQVLSSFPPAPCSQAPTCSPDSVSQALFLLPRIYAAVSCLRTRHMLFLLFVQQIPAPTLVSAQMLPLPRQLP